MNDQITQKAAALASAQMRFEKSEMALSELTSAQADIATRIDEARARRATAFDALRAGELTEAIAAARMEVAHADAADLQSLAEQLLPRIAEALRVRDHAAEFVRQTAADLERAERQILIDALGTRIVEIELILCDAVAEKHRLTVAQGPGSWLQLSTVWRPSDELRAAVVNQVPPKR